MTQGWIKIHRQIQENKLWGAEKFTKGQAWIDLILLANHEDGWFFVRGVKVEVKRGQIGWAEETLAKKWHWSRNKVRNFLKMLKNEMQIEQQKSKVLSLITILNYDRYQEKGTTNETSNDTTERQQKVQQKDTNKNVKNVENEKNDKKYIEAQAPTLSVDEMWTVMITPYLGSLAPRTKELFENHWRAKNLGGKKERWQMEKVFDMGRRLATWKARDEARNFQNSQRIALKKVDEMPREGNRSGPTDGPTRINFNNPKYEQQE